MYLKYSYFILLVTANLFFSCTENNKSKNQKLYFCNAEKTSSDNQFFIDKYNSKITYANAVTKSSERAYRGKYSVKLDSIHQFGMSINIKNVKPGDKFRLSVVKYGNPKAFLIASIGNGYYEKFGENKFKPTKKKGWNKIETIIQVPYNIKYDELSVYVWNASGETVFFDNLKIKKLSEYQNYNFDLHPLYLYIDDTGMQKLQTIRTKAFRKGILETTKDSWVKGSMFYKGEDYKIKLRLKGDWLDHLEGEKWSFRIKIKKGKTWKELKTFSVQNPKSRHFLDEWFAHKIFEKEDVLTTRYDFVPVFLNNKSLGLYAYEEHFEKQLVESRKRREGVIIKFSENQFWATYKHTHNTDSMPVYEAADILPFKMKKTLKNPVLYKQFLIAQNLLYEYKYQLKKASTIFDLKKLAKFYAIVTLTKTYHSLRWHNLRFYYNPIISKLEPVAYDGYTTDGYMAWGGSIFGNFIIKLAENSKPENISNYYIFSDTAFVNEYIKQLEKISAVSYINKCYAENKKKLKFAEKEIQKEFTNYTYDTAFIYNNAKSIRQDLKIYKLRVKERKYDTLHFKKDNYTKYTKKYYEELVPLFINAFTQNLKSNEKTVKVENYLSFPIMITGYAKTDIFVSETIQPIETASFGKQNIKLSGKGINYLCCKIPGINEIFFIKIFPWQSPVNKTPLQELITKDEVITNNNLIIYKNRKYKIDKTIIIPSGKKVIFEPGAELDFTDNAGFISYSPVQMNGTPNNKIIIESSDGTAQGFTILQANKKSFMNNVIFNRLNTLNYKGWTLTGAVTFYESDVIITNCIFKNNLCEDALNIIRSDFDVRNSEFETIFSDAFDSDFCTGKLSETSFNRIGNDAIDFSGSEIKISDCNMKNIDDKGISGGEKSYLEIDNCNIYYANIGIASKDSSKLTVNNSSVNNCNYGLVAFRKKPEFGPASIIADNVKLNNIKHNYLIEKNSFLLLNKKRINGTDKNTAKKLY
ncbi:MAG: hypothetical protein GXO80_08410 [Chlorobi bacterium]|nr:hypothetical protein [Chlorobiota bacterium]